MFAIIKQEFRLNLKSLLIWSITVGGLGLICVLMYTSMEGDVADMADTFSQMGAFSDAFGMSTLSIATLAGFFATEVGTVHGLGSAMFAAFFASCMLSKEEDGHTGEFLFSLPVSRAKVITAKGITILTDLLLFTVICGLFYVIGFIALGEEVLWNELIRFLMSMFMMNIEVSSLTFLISSVSGRNRMGLGLGASLVIYTYDLIGRVIPSLRDYLFIGPFSYSNASEIFAGIEAPKYSILLGVIITIVAVTGAYSVYIKRDLAG